MNLVTGATGHIGNVLIRELLAMNKPVRALVLPSDDLQPINGLPIELVNGNVLDAKSLFQAMQDVETVFHLAGVISIMPGKNDLLRSVNILGTRNIIWASQKANIKRLVYTSSIHALKRTEKGVIIDEKIPFDPDNALSDYDHSKAQASLDVIKATEEGLDAVIVCPTGVIGPFDFRCSEIGQIILDCIKRKLQLYVDGAYDFVDVRDVAKGLIMASEKGKSAETYILSGENWSVRKLLDTIRELSGFKFPRLRVPMTLAHSIAQFTPYLYQFSHLKPRITPYSLETLISNANISHAKAETDLNYFPMPLKESIQDTIKWFLENKIQAAALT